MNIFINDSSIIRIFVYVIRIFIYIYMNVMLLHLKLIVEFFEGRIWSLVFGLNCFVCFLLAWACVIELYGYESTRKVAEIVEARIYFALVNFENHFDG